jgi:integrase/recombinase XerC
LSSVHRDPRFPKGVWYCSFTTAHGRRVMRSTGTKNKTEAKIICQSWDEAERAAAQGSLSTNRAAQIINETLTRCGQEPVTRYRLGAWFSEWLESKQRISVQLLERYRFAVRIFIEFLGPDAERKFLDSIQERDIRAFATHLKSEGRAATTINRILRDLSGGFNRAVRLGKLSFNPIAAVESQKDDGKLGGRRTFTPEEVAKLARASHGTDWQGAILFAYTSGARLQDAANLRWDSIDLENRVVVFHQRKTARQSVIAVHPDFENWLLQVIVPDDPQSFVFPSLANRTTGGKRGLSNEFSNLVKRAGIDAGLIREAHGTHGRSRKGLSFHSLRHGAASSIFNASVVREAARRVTGHAEGGSLDAYLHVDLDAIRAASSLIPRLPL